MLSDKDRARISAAITEAESKTAGEIFCVLTKNVSRYREVPLLWAAMAGFMVPPLLVMKGCTGWPWLRSSPAGPTTAPAPWKA